VRNQLEAAELGMYPSKQIIQSLKKIKRETEKQIILIKEAIEAHLASDEKVFNKIKNIAAIKGLGVLTIAVVLAETNGFLLFENAAQLVSYTGYDVVENQSGTRIGKTKISKKGNARIRRALYMPSLCVIKYKEKVFADFFERNYKRHNIKMKSYVAVQKKLLTIIYALWKKDEVFNPEYKSVPIQNKLAMQLHG
jgi:transposase